MLPFNACRSMGTVVFLCALTHLLALCAVGQEAATPDQLPAVAYDDIFSREPLDQNNPAPLPTTGRMERRLAVASTPESFDLQAVPRRSLPATDGYRLQREPAERVEVGSFDRGTHRDCAVWIGK